MSSFANLKKSRKTSLDSLVKAAEKLTTRTDNGRDNRLWKPEVDKSVGKVLRPWLSRHWWLVY